MLKSDVDRPDEFEFGGEWFTVVRPSAQELTHVKRKLRRAHRGGQIGAALEAVLQVVLSEDDRDRRDKVIEQDPKWGSFPALRLMAPWIAEVLEDEELGRLIDKACGRLDRRVVEINERRDALVRRALQRSLGPMDPPRVSRVVKSPRCSWGRLHIARVPRRSRPVRRVARLRARNAPVPLDDPDEPEPLVGRRR